MNKLLCRILNNYKGSIKDCNGEVKYSNSRVKPLLRMNINHNETANLMNKKQVDVSYEFRQA